MMDFSAVKKLFIPEGEVKQITNNGIVLWKSGPTNQVSLSINADGTIYNNGLGYKNGYRVRSGGAEAVDTDAACTGFIKVKAGDVVRFSGAPWFTGTASSNAINAADASFTNIGQFTMGQGAVYGIFESAYKSYAASSIVEEKSGIWKWIVPPAASGIAYIRISAYDQTNGNPGARMIVTINEEIT